MRRPNDQGEVVFFEYLWSTGGQQISVCRREEKRSPDMSIYGAVLLVGGVVMVVLAIFLSTMLERHIHASCPRFFWVKYAPLVGVGLFLIGLGESILLSLFGLVVIVVGSFYGLSIGSKNISH